MDVGSLTIPQARAKIEEMQAAFIAIRDRVQQSLKRIHEFAPATRDYDLTLVSCTIDDIDQEFYRACAKSPDKVAMAGRLGTTVDQIRELGARSAPDKLPHYIRLAGTRGDVTANYSMPFSDGREAIALGLMQRFRDTQERHGWTITFFGPTPVALPDDYLLAEA